MFGQFVVIPQEVVNIKTRIKDLGLDIDDEFRNILNPNIPGKVKLRMLKHLEMKIILIASDIKKLEEKIVTEDSIVKVDN